MQKPRIYLVGIISPIPKEEYNAQLRKIVKKILVDPAVELEEGVEMTLPNGRTVTCYGTIHSLLGDHMGQSALAGIGGPTSNHGSM